MAERQNERFGALEVDNSTEDIEDTESEMESQSESEEERLKELPPLKQSRLGEVLRSSCGNAVAESRNEAKTPTAASSAHLQRDNQRDGESCGFYPLEFSRFFIEALFLAFSSICV